MRTGVFLFGGVEMDDAGGRLQAGGRLNQPSPTGRRDGGSWCHLGLPVGKVWAYLFEGRIGVSYLTAIGT